MATSNLDNLIREVQALGGHQNAKLSAAAAQLPAPAIARGLVWPIGTRVLDLVTGLEGVVIDGRRENVIISTASNNGG